MAPGAPWAVHAAAACLLALAGMGAAHASGAVPDGTLAYTITVVGAGHGKSGIADVRSKIDWHVHGSFQMKGMAAVATRRGEHDTRPHDAVSDTVADVQQAMAACKGDEACAQRAALAWASGHRARLGHAAASVQGGLPTDPQWRYLGGTCRVSATVDDHEVDTGAETGEGDSRPFTHHGRRTGSPYLQCRGANGPRITADSAKGTYDLQIPWLQIPTVRTGDQIAPGSHDNLDDTLEPALHDIHIRDVHLHALDQPQRGTRRIRLTLHASPGYDLPVTIPVLETVTWKFTPSHG